MKRLESSATICSPPIDQEKLGRRIALFRMRRFESRLLPFRYLIWMGIGLSVGCGVAALGIGSLPRSDVTDLLSRHFAADPPVFGDVWRRLILTLLPVCLALIGASFTYFGGVASTVIVMTEGVLQGGMSVYSMPLWLSRLMDRGLRRMGGWTAVPFANSGGDGRTRRALPCHRGKRCR